MLLRNRTDKKRKGAAIIEAALVLPLFLLLIMGIMEYGRFLMIRHVVDNAAREGARYAVVHTYDKVTADVVDKVNTSLGSQAGTLTTKTVAVYEAHATTGANVGDWKNAKFGGLIAVEINGDYHPVLAGFLFMPNTFHIKTIATMRSEAN